jgi:hypothetical protein
MAQANPESTTTEPDGELLALCKQAAAIEVEIDQLVASDNITTARYRALVGSLDAIYRDILTTRAHTVSGLRANAERVLWCRGGELHLDIDHGSDVRHAMHIVRDLLELSA